MSVMSQCYSYILDCGISAQGHGKEAVDGINSIDRRYIYQLMYNVQQPRSNTFHSQILMHSSTQNNDFSLTK